jgi:hypothetical protein
MCCVRTDGICTLGEVGLSLLLPLGDLGSLVLCIDSNQHLDCIIAAPYIELTFVNRLRSALVFFVRRSRGVYFLFL